MVPHLQSYKFIYDNRIKGSDLLLLTEVAKKLFISVMQNYLQQVQVF